MSKNSENLVTDPVKIAYKDWTHYLHKHVIVENISDDGIVALNKPEGILSHPNADQQASNNAILTCKYSFKDEAYHSNNLPIAYLLNRIDSPVSGLILIGLNSDIAQIVRSAFREKTLTKKYLALLKGHLINKRGTWRSNISKCKNDGTVRATKNGDKIAITEYTVLQEFSWRSSILSLVELHPITGRTHQLRLHCAQNLTPIVGDKVYGNFAFNKKFTEQTKQKRLFLHSNEIVVPFHINGHNKVFRAHSSYAFKDFCTNILNS